MKAYVKLMIVIIAILLVAFISHQYKKAEMEKQKQKIEVLEHKEMAYDLSLDLEVVEDGDDMQIEVSPTDETFEIFKRWEALHKEKSHAIPYDAEAVNSQDWEKIHKVFGEIDSSKHEALYNYIIHRSVTDNPLVQELDEELYRPD